MSQPSKSKLSYGVLCNDNGEKYYLCEDQVGLVNHLFTGSWPRLVLENLQYSLDNLAIRQVPNQLFLYFYIFITYSSRLENIAVKCSDSCENLSS